MIVKAAVQFHDLRQDKDITIPCYRHCDAFEIMKTFGYLKSIDYIEGCQGFLDENNQFYNRIEAWKHARACGQVTGDHIKELYSEDLW